MSPQKGKTEAHDKENEFFLSCLRDFCAGRKTLKPDSVPDVAVLAKAAEAHDLGSVVYSQCRRWACMMPGGSALQRSFLKDVFLSVNRADVLKDVAREYANAGIRAIVMKGAVLRGYYPEPALRSMGDIDLVIRHEDREKCDLVMTDVIGFKKFETHQDVWTYSIGDIIAEVHNRMFYEDLSPKVDYPAYFDRVWERCRRAPVFGIESDSLYIPDDEFHFLYLMAHTAKHVIVSGCGLRAYLDMAMTIRLAGKTMDWEWIQKELEKLELFDFTKTCFSLCEKWFGVDMPFEKGPLDEDFYRTVTEKTFEDGVFGYGNDENDTASAARDLGSSGVSYDVAAVKRGIRKFFPSYSNMRLIPWYSFVDGRPYLLPAAWAYRLGYCTVKKFRESVHFLAQPFTEKEEIKERQRLLRDWGL